MYDPIQQLAIVDDDVLEMFGVDTINMARGFALTEDPGLTGPCRMARPARCPRGLCRKGRTDRWVFRSKSGRVIAQLPDGALYFEQTYFPFADDHGPQTIPEAMQESMWHVMGCPPGPWVDFAQLGELIRAAKTDTIP